jgi:FKBP-type peptidyl-prolyl cis-trans isomerase 2
MRVAKDKVVTIEYRMMDAAGNLMGTSDHAEPLSFIQGRAMVFPAVEHQVDGRSVGERIVCLQTNLWVTREPSGRRLLVTGIK